MHYFHLFWLQRDGALDSLNLELGSLAAASPKAGLELGSLLRQPSLEGSVGARQVLNRSLAGTCLLPYMPQSETEIPGICAIK